MTNNVELTVTLKATKTKHISFLYHELATIDTPEGLATLNVGVSALQFLIKLPKGDLYIVDLFNQNIFPKLVQQIIEGHDNA